MIALRHDEPAVARRQLAARIAQCTAPNGLHLDGQPPAVQRYFTQALANFDVLPVAASIEMRGRIKVGRWLPFRARQLLAPRLGSVWEARVGGLILGSDRYVARAGAMDWRVLGIVPVVHADGPDVSRSAAGRAAGESIWVPSAVVPRPGVTWSAEGDEIAATFATDDLVHTIHHRIAADGTVLASWFDRWGDPEDTGTWSSHPFGVEITGYRTFGSTSIPNRGRAGWHQGTDRWPGGVFFEFEITGYEGVRPRLRSGLPQPPA